MKSTSTASPRTPARHAIPSTRDELLAWHAARARAEAKRRASAPRTALAGRLVADSDGTLHIAPEVHCGRSLARRLSGMFGRQG